MAVWPCVSPVSPAFSVASSLTPAVGQAAPDFSSSLQASPYGPLTLQPGSPTQPP